MDFVNSLLGRQPQQAPVQEEDSGNRIACLHPNSKPRLIVSCRFCRLRRGAITVARFHTIFASRLTGRSADRWLHFSSALHEMVPGMGTHPAIRLLYRGYSPAFPDPCGCRAPMGYQAKQKKGQKMDGGPHACLRQ